MRARAAGGKGVRKGGEGARAHGRTHQTPAPPKRTARLAHFPLVRFSMPVVEEKNEKNSPWGAGAIDMKWCGSAQLEWQRVSWIYEGFHVELTMELG